MKIHRYLSTINEEILPATLNSYSIVFFLNNRLFAYGMIVISFFNFFA